MSKIFAVTMLALALCFGACQKQQTDEERRAEVERQVQERVAAEHQQQQAQELAQREASLAAREQALNERTPEPASTPEPETTRGATSGTESSYSTFYTKLEPYGDWIETDDYGYVYRPREAENTRWRPYTNGRWAYTDAGWTWISEEPFGWATYHYGRWARLRSVGWVWVPGNEWAPAWVSWRKGGQYVGWAPLPPEAQFDRASGIHNWSDNYYDIGPDQYVFVQTSEIGEQRIERVIVPSQQNVTIVNQTTNITNITYNNTVIVNQGPNYDELRGQSRTPIQRLRLQRETAVPAENAHTVVHGDIVTIPAPVIQRAPASARPRAIKQTVKQAEVDRGWSAIGNQREAEQARAKMKSEATPPPNAPAKKFVKAASAPVTTPSAPSATAATKVTPVATSTMAHPGTPPPATPPQAMATPPVTPLPSASSPPKSGVTAAPIATIHPRLTPPPAGAPSATASQSPTPATGSPPPMRSPVVPPNVRHGPPPRVSPSVAASPAPELTGQTASPSASATDSPVAGEQRRGEKKRPLPRRERPAETSPSPSPR